jgi:serine/threonine-protein kinase RIO1
LKTPEALKVLIEDGVIDAVLRPLKSGKEASVYVVRCHDEVRCAKVYKDMATRSFKQRTQYQEGRKVRGSREARAVGKASKYGKKQQEVAWKNTEVDALYQLRAAGNNAARGMLLRDVNNLTASLGQWAPELLDTWYGEEIWALFAAGALDPDSELTGNFEHDESTVDLEGVREAIEDARQEALIREQGRLAKAEEDAGW